MAPLQSLCTIFAALPRPCWAAATGHDLPAWETVFPQHVNRDYLQTRPRTRYGHTATVVGDAIIVVHGYFYDHKGCISKTMCGDGKGATWHSDVWALSLVDGRQPSWRQITDGRQAGPQARMNHATVATPGGETVVVFGGSGKKDMKFKDVWELDIRNGRWSEHKPEQQSAWPTPRDCMSAVVLGSAMVIFGGFLADERSGELWRFDFRSHKWELLMDTPKQDRTDHPGRRVAHSAVATTNGEDMYLVGGFRFQGDVSDASKFAHGKLDDLWLYTGRDNKWRRLQQVGNYKRQWAQMLLMQWPSAAFSAAPFRDHLGLLVFGGTLCNPNCSLIGSMSFFSLQDERWYPIEVQKEPLARYHHSLVLYKGALWLFGGESYQPHMYHNSVERFLLSASGSSEL